MDADIADRVHLNLMEVQSWLGEARGGAVDRRGDELLYASRSPLPFLNGALRRGPDGDAVAFLARARSFFFGRRRGFVTFTWPGDPDLAQAALSAGMVLAMKPFPEMVRRTPLDRLAGDVRPVLDVDDARTYWEICEAAYPSLGIPAGTFSEAFDPEQLLDSDRIWACLAYQDERPVACASSWFAGGVGCLGWIASLPDVRGRGLAAACTVAATNQTLKLGAEVVSLQATEMGEDLYRRLGFEEIFAYRVLGATPD